MSVHPSTPTRSEAERDAALCRAALYSAIALGFRPPADETLSRLCAGDGTAALADAARALDALAGTELAPLARRLRRPEATLASLEAAHRELFGHTVRTQAPAYETEYGNEALFQQPQQLSDLSGFMAAFGLTLDAGAHERIDHVSCECEFMAFLSYKEAYAIAAGDDDAREVTGRAAKLFLADHLGRFAPAFTARVRRSAGEGFHTALASLLTALVTYDCRRLGVALGSEALSLRPDPALVAAPMGCETADGSCGGCP